MKKALIILGVVVAISIGGYALYRSFFSNTSYGSVNVNIGALDEKAVSEMCKGASGHARIVCLAGELKKTLVDETLAKLQLSYSVADAQRWSNFPPAGYNNRVGLTLDKFTKEQLVIVKAILKEATGTAANEGYDEIEQILNADDFLKANVPGDNAGFSSGNFHIAFIGTPSDTGTWQLYFGGHHLAVSNTYKDGKLIGATPSFRGVEPFGSFTQNGRENNPMKQEQETFAAMLGALDENEQKTAMLGQTFTDIIAGPQKDKNFPSAPSGIRVGNLSREKQALVVKAIETYVGDIDDADSRVIMEKYKNESADTYIAYSGTTGLNTVNDYVRIDGPSVWIEISMQRAASWNGVHPHTVWRDKNTDYGGNLK
ncbi:MAG TPA: DUF3500 domain-containing protein [Pyrinomonadaceae bacterium]|jgi:hypothetical protein